MYAITFDAPGPPAARHRQSRQDLPPGLRTDQHATDRRVTHAGHRFRQRRRMAICTQSPGTSAKCFGSGPGFEKNGTFESEVLDAGSFAYWGRDQLSRLRDDFGIHAQRKPEPSGKQLEPLGVRSAGHRRPAACDSCGGGRTTSPSARFLQYKIDMSRHPATPAPEVSYVEVAYLPKNVAPVVEANRHHTAQLPFPCAGAFISPPSSHHAPALGQPRSLPRTPVDRTTASVSVHELRQGI